MSLFFRICLLMLPWVIIPSGNVADPFRLPKATFFDLMCLGMISISLYQGVRFFYRNKYLFWFSMWVFITCFFNWYLPSTLTFNNQQAFNIATIEPTIHFILGLWASFIALSYFDKDDYHKIAKTICVSAALVSAFGILQILGLDPLGKLIKNYNHPVHIYAFLDNPDIVGNYLCLCLPFFFLFFKEKKYILMFLLTILATILTRSHFSVFCGLIGIIVFLLLSYRNRIKKSVSLILPFILLIILCVKFLPKILPSIIQKFGLRLEAWKIAFTHLKDNPLFGQGLGMVKTWIIKPVDSLWLSAHNDWLQYACEIGILGIFLLILVIINSLRNFNYKSENVIGFAYLASFVSFLILMFGSFPLEVAPVALLGLIGFWATDKL